MVIRVFMRDGRTCYRLHKRAHLGELVNRQPEGLDMPSIRAEVGYRIERGDENEPFQLTTWRPVWLRQLSKGSISHVEQERQPPE